MSITREQLADLRVGDVVEITNPMWPTGSVVRGAVVEETSKTVVYGSGYPDTGKQLLVCGSVLRWSDGAPAMRGDLAVISRAPRSLYVNHDRTEPVPGDVVRFVCDDHPDDSYTNAFLPRTEQDGLPWVSLTHDPGERYSDENADCRHLSGWRMVLLVDGETGQVVQ